MIKQTVFVIALFMGASEAHKIHHKSHKHTFAQHDPLEIQSVAGPEHTNMFGPSVHRMVMGTPGVPANPLPRHDSVSPGPNAPWPKEALHSGVRSLVQKEKVFDPAFEYDSVAGPEFTNMFGASVHRAVIGTPGVPAFPLPRHNDLSPGPNAPWAKADWATVG
jgi:hypothetical protein